MALPTGTWIDGVEGDAPASGAATGAAPAPPMGTWAGGVEGNAPPGVVTAASPDAWHDPSDWHYWLRQQGLGARDVLNIIPGGGMAATGLGLPKPDTPADVIAGQIVSGVGGAAATALTGGAMAASPALGATARAVGNVLAQQPVRQAVVGGLSGAAGGTTAAAGAPWWAQDAAAYGTALLSGLAPGARISATLNPTEQLEDIAKTKWGIPIYPTGAAYRVASSVPGSRAPEAYRTQLDAVNAAVGRTFGAATEGGQLTPAAFNDARTGLNTGYGNLAATAGPTRVLGTPLDGTLSGIESSLSRIGAEGQPLQAEINNLRQVQAANNGQLPTGFALNMLKYGTPLSDMAASSGNVRQYAVGMKTALQNALEAQSPGILAQKAGLDEQWGNMLTAAKNVVNGDVNPQTLSTTVKSARQNYTNYTGGDLYELGQIGKQFIRPPSTRGAESVGYATAMAAPEAAGLLWAGHPWLAASTLGAPAMTAATVGAASRLGRLGALTPAPPPNYYARILANPGYTPLVPGGL